MEHLGYEVVSRIRTDEHGSRGNNAGINHALAAKVAGKTYPSGL